MPLPCCVITSCDPNLRVLTHWERMNRVAGKQSEEKKKLVLGPSGRVVAAPLNLLKIPASSRETGAVPTTHPETLNPGPGSASNGRPRCGVAAHGRSTRVPGTHPARRRGRKTSSIKIRSATCGSHGQGASHPPPPPRERAAKSKALADGRAVPSTAPPTSESAFPSPAAEATSRRSLPRPFVVPGQLLL
jgi:hypothetical protein